MPSFASYFGINTDTGLITLNASGTGINITSSGDRLNFELQSEQGRCYYYLGNKYGSKLLGRKNYTLDLTTNV